VVTEAVVTESRAELYMWIERSRDSLVELIGHVEKPVSLVEFSMWKRKRYDMRIGTYLCKYSDAEPSANIM